MGHETSTSSLLATLAAPSDPPALVSGPVHLPYPWTSGPGLANVLDDPELWARMIRTESLRSALLQASRSTVRPAARRLGRRAQAGEPFGEAITATLRDAGRRTNASRRLHERLTQQKLRCDFSVPDVLAENIVLWLNERGAGGPAARFVPDALTPTILRGKLDAARFQELLRGLESAPASFEIALMASAMAMIRPDEGRRFAEALLTCNPGYERLVVRYQDSIDAIEDGQIEFEYVEAPVVRARAQRAPRRPGSERPGTEGNPRPVPVASMNPTPAGPVEDPAARMRRASQAAIEDAAATLGHPALTAQLSRLLADAMADPSAVERRLTAFREAFAELERQCTEAGRSLGLPPGDAHATIESWIEEFQLAAMEVEEAERQRRDDERVAAALCDRLVQSQAPGFVPVLAAHELAALLRTLGAAAATTEAGRRIHALRALDEVVSGALAALAQLDLEAALEIVAGLTAPLQRHAMAGLNLAQLAQAVPLRPSLAPLLVRALFVAAIRGDRLSDVADYLETMLHGIGHSPTATFYGVCLRAAGRGEPVVELVRELAAGRGASTRASRVLELIDLSPGMIGIYHRLRLLAQERFFRPLRGEIVAHDVAGARRRWQEFGDIEDMVATCIYSFPNGGREIDDNHVEQTRRFLRNFADALDEWEQGCGDLRARPGLREVVDAWSALAETDELIAQLRGTVEVPADVGARYVEGRGGLLCVAKDLPIDPELVRSWILRCDGDEVPLAVHLADLIRDSIGAAATREDAVREMLAARHFAAALRAAEGDAVLAARVQSDFDAHRRCLEERYAAPLGEARATRGIDPAIDDFLCDLDGALAAHDIRQAESWLAELGGFLCERERERDPERRAAREFLGELGELAGPSDETREALLLRVERARERHGERRWHVLALQSDASLDALSMEIDRPRLWPTSELSKELCEAIELFRRYVASHARRYRDYDPEPVDRLVETADAWLAAVLRAGLPERRPLMPLLELVGEIREFAPVRRVAGLLAVGPAAVAVRAEDAAGRRALAHQHYARGEYAACMAAAAGQPEAELLRSCAQVMEILNRGTPLDIDWNALRTAIGAARRASGATAKLVERLNAIDALAEVFARSIDVMRVIDHLAAAGPKGYDATVVRAVMFALSLHLEVCQAKPPAEAFSLAMMLPEQIFRVWARWRLGLDMTYVPSGRQVVWQMVEDAWDPDGRGNRLWRPSPGEPFPSFRCFALFAQTELRVRGSTGAGGVLEKSVDELHAAFRVLRIRNDGAHALSRPTEAQREQFFGLIRRWLEQLFLACPLRNGETLRREIRELLEPLPLAS